MKGGEQLGGGGTVVRSGYLKKMKTSRRKYFVLRAETSESSAKLEYYDSERKFTSGCAPKRCIPLKNCFNINRRADIRQHKHVIALYTKDDCFCVVLESEDEVENWLKALLSLQHGEDVVDGGEMPKPTFEHVWQVTVVNRGLGTAGLTGNYRLCLTDKTLSLIKKESEVPLIELNLPNIRSCGNLHNFFFLEIGRSSTLGAGELWMQTEDNNIAQNVHATVFHAMSTNNSVASKEAELGPKSRNRSSSATESSKPGIMSRKQFHTGAPPKCLLSQDALTPLTDSNAPSTSTSSSSQNVMQHSIVSGVTSFCQHLIQRGGSKASERRHSISAGGLTSSMISHQRTQSLPLANPAPISEQNTTTTTTTSSCASSQFPLRAAASSNKRSSANQSSKCMSGGRERCDSMPSRPRTTSEGTVPPHSTQYWGTTTMTTPTAPNNANPIAPPIRHFGTYRPQSLHGRDISHSPPSGSPVSPPSVGCSTDSGSSYSLADEADGCTDIDATTIGRYSHSLTPDEAIAEEDCPDSPLGFNAASPYSYVPMQLHSSDDGYVDMSPKGRGHNNSPTASLSSVTSGTPSTDMRFAEYPLEKVISYFPPSSEDGDDSRPARAYSVGSRPETYKKYDDNLRVRALSVGSKTKKLLGRVLPPHAHHTPISTAAAAATTSNKKSSSAPILNNSRNSSHTSIGPMDDLMEMDFSRSSSVTSTGYMEMRPGATPDPKPAAGYVEMRPGATHPYVDMMAAGSSPAKGAQFNDRSSNKENDYMPMDANNKTLINNNHINATDYLDMSLKSPSNSTEHFIDVHFGQDGGDAATTPDGYVEMSVGGRKGATHARQSSYDGKKVAKVRCSQPIAIQLPPRSSSANSPIFSTMGAAAARKFSGGGTSPKMHLALNSEAYGSLPRYRGVGGGGGNRKNSARRDSRDSSSSSITTTPSSSSTIFPMSLNSPCSPVGPAMAAATNTATIKVPPAVLNAVYKKHTSSSKFDVKQPSKTDMSPIAATHHTSRTPAHTSDYTCMDFDCGKSAKNELNQTASSTISDYVNYAPASPPSTDDYAFMAPRLLPSQMTAMRIVDSPLSFRPISEDDNAEGNGAESPYEKLRGAWQASRPGSASSELCSSSAGSTVVGGSRPESVDSDRAQQLHYASLELVEGGARSPRALKSAGDAGLTYSAIDFGLSEGLKHSSSNSKVKH